MLKLAVRMANDYGCVGGGVDAKRDALDFYAKYGFIPVDAVDGRSSDTVIVDGWNRWRPRFATVRSAEIW